MSEKISANVAPGVAVGNAVQEIFKAAKENNFAIPAVNVVGTDSVNAVMEAAKAVNSPVIIQFSNGGGIFYAGKSLKNDNEIVAIQGSISGAQHIHEVAELYGIPVIIHTDHAAKKLLPWIDGLLGRRGELLQEIRQATFQFAYARPFGRAPCREHRNQQKIS